MSPWIVVLRVALRRRGVFLVLGLTVVLAVTARVLDGVIGTPQISGADGSLEVRSAIAAIEGACMAGLVVDADSLAEARSPRPLAVLRCVLAALVVAVGATLFAAPLGAGWSWPCARIFLLVAAGALLLTRFLGVVAAAAAFVTYVGLCLFAGVPWNSSARWWAVPMQPATTSARGPILIVAATAICVVLTFWRPKLSAGRRRLHKKS